MVHSELLDNIYKLNVQDFKKSLEDNEETFKIIKDIDYEYRILKYKNKMMKYLNEYNKEKFDNNYIKYKSNLYNIYDIELNGDIGEQKETLWIILYYMDIVNILNNRLSKLIDLTIKITKDYNRGLYVYRMLKEQSMRNLETINYLYPLDLIKVFERFEAIRNKFKEYFETYGISNDEIRGMVLGIIELIEDFDDYKTPKFITALKIKRKK